MAKQAKRITDHGAALYIDRLPKGLAERAKQKAADEGLTMREVIVDLLTLWVEGRTNETGHPIAVREAVRVLAAYLVRDGAGASETGQRGPVARLRDEAAAAGDLERVAICDRALDGDDAALREVSPIIMDGYKFGYPRVRD